MKIQHLPINHGGNLYKNEVHQIHQRITHEPKIIFDLGANVGGFTVELAKKYPNATIYAFEPVKVTFERLVTNTKSYFNVKTFNIGLSNITQNNVPIGMPEIPAHKTHNYGRSTINDFKGEPIDYINLVNFSEWCTKTNIFPDMMKIDVEGCEYDILKNAHDSNILKNVKIVYIEINNVYSSSQSAKELLLQSFKIVGDSGYNINNNEPLNYIFRND